mgnify:CR=1 FL=1
MQNRVNRGDAGYEKGPHMRYGVMHMVKTSKKTEKMIYNMALLH